MGVDEAVEKKFQGRTVVPSDAVARRKAGNPPADPRDLVKKMKVEMPTIRTQCLVRDDQLLVYWERQVRNFIKHHVSPRHPYRITASMIWIWVNGEFETKLRASQANPDLRRINKVLRHYFGESFKTSLMGKPSYNTYRIKRGFYLRYQQPLSLTLYVEFLEGSLYP